MNNSTLYTADRATHLKIGVGLVALIGATLIAGFGIAARNLNLGTDILTAQAPTVHKPGPDHRLHQPGHQRYSLIWN